MAASQTFQLHLETTPARSDPKDADALYRALGVAVVVLGRLENRFLACIINILGLPETTHLAKRFPVTFDQRAKIWSRAFAESPTLGAKQIEANKLLAELDDVLEDRILLAHGQWGKFNGVDPLSIHVPILSSDNSLPYGMGVKGGSLTIEQINAIATKANRLNLELMPLSMYIAELRAKVGVPPLAPHKL
jgi:hypothetical protein